MKNKQSSQSVKVFQDKISHMKNKLRLMDWHVILKEEDKWKL